MTFTEDDLLLWIYRDYYLLAILNGEYDVEDAREDLQRLIVKNQYHNDTK